MAFEVTATGSPTIKAVEGWGWAQLSTDTYNNLGWGHPSFAAVSGWGTNDDMTMHFPEFTLIASGDRVSYGGTFDVPAFSVTGEGGGTQLNATLRLSADITGTSLHLGRLTSARVPKFTLTGSGITEGSGAARPRVRKFTLAGYGAANASMDWPKITLTGVGTVEETGDLVDTEPCDFVSLFTIRWSLTGSGTASPQGSADVDIPAFSMQSGNDEYIEFPHFWIDGRAA